MFFYDGEKSIDVFLMLFRYGFARQKQIPQFIAAVILGIHLK
jgi:hypothetical protein